MKKKKVFKYDTSGKYIEDVLISENDPTPANCTDKELPQPNWKPVYDRVKKVWIETITEEEKATLTNGQAQKSEIEILKEELEATKEETAQLNLAIIDLWEMMI